MDLLIFDCDGVLVDSEPLACEVVADVLADIGFPITREEFFTRFAGVSDREMYAQLEIEHGRQIGAEIRQRVNHEILVALSSRLEAIPGIHSAIQAIDVRTCIASGSDRRRVEASLRRTGLLEHFAGRIFNSEQVPRGKPAPDLFLYAAAQMQAAPNRCVVIEDSQAGVQAAVSAGMRVLGFVGGTHCRPGREEVLRRQGAEHVFHDMRELPALLGFAE